MALYIAVTLLAVLSAVADRTDHGDITLGALVWGTTIGLALAHVFAFRVSARLVARGSVTGADAEVAGAQLAGAAFVAAVASLPIVVLGPTAELDVARVVLALFVAAMGYLVAKAAGATRGRAITYGIVILVVALVIATVKNILGGH
jgi:hypothetical protein